MSNTKSLTYNSPFYVYSNIKYTNIKSDNVGGTSNCFKGYGILRKRLDRYKSYSSVKIIQKRKRQIDDLSVVDNGKPYGIKVIGPIKKLSKILSVGDRFKGYRHDDKVHNEEIEGIIIAIYINERNNPNCEGFCPRLEFSVKHSNGGVYFMYLEDFL